MDRTHLPSPRHELADGLADDLLTPFDYDPRTRLVYGPGVLKQLGELTKSVGGNRVLLVTDPGIHKAGHSERGVAVLRDAGLDVVVFEEVQPNPTTDDVARGLSLARDHKVDVLVGLGGGSAMDVAKGINFILTNGGEMRDYWGVGKATKPMLPMIAVPTTSGTGSEAQSFALIADAKTHMKMACGDKKAAPRIALLDPELTVSMPKAVTAATGIDAVSHAIESYVTTRRNAISQLFARRAWRMLSWGLPRVLHDPKDLTARGTMLLGSHLAGAAIENSMLGATHALVNPLSAHFNTTHGIAIGVMLPHVVRYNTETVGRLYGRLAHDAGLCDRHEPRAGQLLADHITRLVALTGSPTSLEECQVDAGLIPQMSEEAAAQWTGKFNPRPVDASSLRRIYECAYSNNGHHVG
ncbi:MAG: iron-containing alcohol dehydrogenase [Planctomycetaceae bacterium]|nr:iron-containing alcohol dehydrogenase [Planctomycetaceae bacterium]